MSNGIVFRGYRRVFFLVLALAFCMQLVLFVYERSQTALNLITDDFKIVLTLPDTSLDAAQDFAAKTAALPDVNAAAVLNPQDVLPALKESSPAAAQSIAGILANFLPQHITLSVSTDVLLNPQVWLQENILKDNPQIIAEYKQPQVQTALYFHGAAKLVKIVILLALFCLLAFGFFVEAYFTKISPFKERIGGIFSACIAYFISAGAFFALAYPLNMLSATFKYNILNPLQLAVFAICAFMGLTLAKWKKF